MKDKRDGALPCTSVSEFFLDAKGEELQILQRSKEALMHGE